jgi:hypothetical protein
VKNITLFVKRSDTVLKIRYKSKQLGGVNEDVKEEKNFLYIAKK